MIIEGILTDIIYYNEENGYVICNIETLEDVYCVKGLIPFVKEGDRLRIEGSVDEHPFYGTQLQIKHVEHVKPSDLEEIYKYLSSGVITGIGEATARLIVDTFGEEALTIIEKNPTRLLEIPGIGEKKLDQIVMSYHEAYAMRDFIIYFQNLGLTINAAMRIFKKFGLEGIEKIQQNPYLLASEIPGFGFKQADELAMKMGIEKHSPFRIESGILHLLAKDSMSGDTYSHQDVLIKHVGLTLQVPADEVQMQLRSMAVNGGVYLENGEEGQRVYLPSLYYAEQQVASKLVSLMKHAEQSVRFNMDDFTSNYEKEMGICLASLQKEALKKATASGVFVLTGGPGTGKTTLINALISAYEMAEKKVLLCAPTGRAAKRMTEATMRESKTIHRLLEFQGENQFGKNESEPLRCDVVIVDEISMVDVVLMYRLLDAMPLGTHLILVGDSDQLPSVGPGAVLKDILACGGIENVALNEIFRQSEASLIAVNAHSINHGERPVLNVPDKDFFFIARQQAKGISDEIKTLVSQRLPEYYGFDPTEDIQVLSPMKNSEAGVTALNELLQEVVNPPKKEKAEHQFGKKKLRVGDKVMQVKNNYNLEWQSKYGEEGTGVFNGDIGFITEIDSSQRQLTVNFDGEREVVYDFPTVEELVLAYAVTVHKSQGSEFKAIVMPITYGPSMLMSRNILYTAITRAKSLVVLVGEKRALYEMIDRNQEQMRKTGLRQKLSFYLEMI